MDKLTKAEIILLEIAVQLGEATCRDSSRQATSLHKKGLVVHSGSFITPTVKPTNAGREWVADAARRRAESRRKA